MTAAALTVTPTAQLRRLYLSRFTFAIGWAIVFALLGSSLTGGSIALLLLYPVVDVVAAVVDHKSSKNPLLYLNIAVSSVAAIGLAVASADNISAVLKVWAAWAIVAGAVQLTVALKRRAALGGQWAMILSGGISVLAGIGFAAQSGNATSMRMLAGYATLGGIFFLVSAIRLPRQQ